MDRHTLGAAELYSRERDCLFLSLNITELQQHVCSGLTFTSSFSWTKGLSKFLYCQLQKVSLTRMLTKPKSIHHRSLNYRKCSLQDYTDFEVLLLIYILGWGYTRDLLLLQIPGIRPLLQLVYSLSKNIGWGIYLLFYIYLVLGFFFLTGIFTPASWLLNLWGCPCFKTSCFTVLCDFTEYLHALPPNGCKAESHEPICTCRLMSCAALCSSLGFGLLYSGIEEKTLTEG